MAGKQAKNKGNPYPELPLYLIIYRRSSNCTVEITQYALKGQKLLAQGIALGNYGHKLVALKGQKL